MKTRKVFCQKKHRQNRHVCGSVAGISYWDDIITDAKNKAILALKTLAIDTKLVSALSSYTNYKSLGVSKFFTPKKIIDNCKVFLDMQNDVTTLDIKLSITEGYKSIEHIKRYTAMGFGTDQGKTGNINGIAVASEFLGLPITQVSTTTFRPAYTGVAFGALSGRNIGSLFAPERLTVIHNSHIELGAKFELVGQWYRPWYYPKNGENIQQAINRESIAARTSLAVMDASTLGKIDIQGRDAREFLSRIYTNSWSDVSPGSCRYGIMCDEKGMIIDDGVSVCINNNHFIMTTTTGGAASVYATLEAWLQTEWPYLDVYINSITDQYATIAVVGPNSRNLMKTICSDIDFSREKFKFMQWRSGVVAGVKARIMRISFSGELAYEINVEANYGNYIWQQVLDNGKKWHITPYGTETMHLLRAEKGYIIVGQDTDGSMTPADVNMNWILAKDKQFSYIGKRSFSLPSLTAKDRLQLVGLYTDDKKIVLAEGSHIIDKENNKSIGYVTSSYFSAVLERSIAMALIKGGLSKMGSPVVVKITQHKRGLKEIPVTIVSSVFYDKKGERSDGYD